jgi:hypothetical protein
MTSLHFEKKKILIWGKTYPELSSKYLETVCTGGVTETGSPIRLYPIPYRYLQGDDQFRKYQWIMARIARNHTDPRPESHQIDYESIEVGDMIETDEYEWSQRAAVMFQDRSWQFDTMEDLYAAQKAHKTSIGIVAPREILRVDLFARPDEDGETFNEKLDRLRKLVAADREQRRLFEEFKLPELKGLEFVANRIRIHWLCHSANCNGHKMQILDWEAIQLQRNVGDAKALQKVLDVCDMKKYALRFFLSNTHAHQGAFSIVGIWYPKKAAQRLLFS